MKKVYALKYDTIANLIKDKLVVDFTNDTVNLEKEVIKKFISNKCDLKVNKNIYISSKNNMIYVYLLSKYTKTLLFKLTSLDNMELTEFGQELLKTEEEKASCLMEVLANMYCINSLIDIENTRDVKKIKSTFNTKLKIKKSELEITVYPEVDDNYIIKNKSGRVEILNNNHTKQLIQVPTKLYPLPNKNEIKVFTKDNTSNLNTEDINNVLSNIIFKPGHCYTNSEKIMKLLTEANLNHKIEFYGGWLYSCGNMIHHAWIVVDDTHIIDTAFFLEEDDYDLLISHAEQGLKFNIDKNKIANKTVRLAKSNKAFKEKYSYGKVLRDNLYIGVKCSAEEATQSFLELMKHNPNHPNYLNCNADGSNETLNLIYQQM